MEEVKFRNLRADEIEVRIGDKKDGKMSLLLFQDARCAMRILDETLGQFGWACQYKEEKGTLFAGIALKAKDGTWVWKWDAGAPSNFEKEKGEASDAFKRAAVRWGIGRSLYSAPKIRIPESNSTHYVSVIGYDDNGNINDLEVRDWNDEVVFLMAEGQIIPQSERQVDRTEVLRIFCSEQKKAEGVDTKSLLKFWNYYKDRVDKFDSFNAKIAAKLWGKWNSK